MGDDLSLALGGGEDYELLFCARPDLSEHALTKALGLPVHRIGRIIEGIANRHPGSRWHPRAETSRMGSVAGTR